MFNESFPDPENNMVIYTNDFKRWPSSTFEKLENSTSFFQQNTELGINIMYSSPTQYFEKTFKERSEKKLKFLAKQLGYELLPVEQNLIEEGHVS